MVISVDWENLERIVPFPFPVLRTGRTVNEQRGTVHFRKHDHGEICIRTSSSGEPFAEDMIADVHYRTPFPHVILKAPDVEYANSLNFPRNAYHFCYRREIWEKMSEIGIFPERPVWKIEFGPALTELLHGFRELQERAMERTVADRIDTCCFQILQELIFQKDGSSEKKDYTKEKILAIASRLQTEENYAPDIDRIASEYGMSRRTFFRHWKLYFNESPAQYLLRFRLKNAERMLMESNRKVESIAEYLGFSDSAYFVRLFRRQYHTTPLKFRKEHNKFF